MHQRVKKFFFAPNRFASSHRNTAIAIGWLPSHKFDTPLILPYMPSWILGGNKIILPLLIVVCIWIQWKPVAVLFRKILVGLFFHIQDWSTLPTIYASNRYIGTMEQRLNAKQISTSIRTNRSAKLFKLLLIMYNNTYDQANYKKIKGRLISQHLHLTNNLLTK